MWNWPVGPSEDWAGCYQNSMTVMATRALMPTARRPMTMASSSSIIEE